MAAGGIVAGPVGAIMSLGFEKRKVIDAREVYLLVDAGAASSVVSCPPEDGERARRFAMTVNTSAEAYAGFRRDLPGLLIEAQQDVATAEADTGDVVAAERELARVREDPDAVARTARAARQVEWITARQEHQRRAVTQVGPETWARCLTDRPRILSVHSDPRWGVRMSQARHTFMA